MSQPVRKKATYEDVLAAPDHMIAEIIDGELLLSPRPASPHAIACSAMGYSLGPPFHHEKPGPPGPGGWWILDEPELHLHQDILVPDLAGWRRDRMPRIPNVAFFTQAPDWLCEVLSPSSVHVDRIRKMDLYARAGVGHVWIVDPGHRTVEVFRLTDGMWVYPRAWAGNEAMRAEPFDAVDIDLSSWWMPEGEVTG